MPVTDRARPLWARAERALASARTLAASDPDGAASRAYYAAFYAISTLFEVEGRPFRKHSAFHVAVHRDLVRAGRWPQSLGATLTALWDVRTMGDYGAGDRVTAEQAARTIEWATELMTAVRSGLPPEMFDR